MPFAQRNYTEILGQPGTETIADAGCFLTSFCNLEQDFGVNIDPPTLNRDLINSHAYLSDGSSRDFLSWSSITQFDNQTQVVRVVDRGSNHDAGWPDTNHAIVRFYYRSISYPTLPSGHPNMIWHFCKMHDLANHTILDSWDGVIKPSPYGEPTGWATYERITPTPVHVNPALVVAPVPAPEPPLYVITPITPKKVKLNKTTKEWDLSHDSWASIEASPVATANAGNIKTVVATLKNKLGGEYYLEDASVPHGYNVVDCDDYVYSSTVIQAPAQTGKPVYTVITTIMGFSNANDAVNHLKAKGTVSAGKYFVYNTRYGMLNVTKDPKVPGSWINPGDNLTPEPPAPSATDKVAVTVKPPDVTPKDPNIWKASYRPLRQDRKGVKYVLLEDYAAHDLDGRMQPDPVKIPRNTELAFYGTFIGPDGEMYYRPKLRTDTAFQFYVGIPETVIRNGQRLPLVEAEQLDLTVDDFNYSSKSLDFAEKVDKGIQEVIKVVDGIIRRK